MPSFNQCLTEEDKTLIRLLGIHMAKCQLFIRQHFPKMPFVGKCRFA